MSKEKIILEDLGRIAYQQAWDYQKQLFQSVLEAKKEGITHKNYLLFCEHPPVYTLGKSGNREHLLINDEMLRKIGATFQPIDRGGDITFHGPGQLVGYPIFDLDTFTLSIKDFVFQIEAVIIRTLKHYGIFASRIEHATGVWIDAGKPNVRKIAAIGMRIHNKVSMHGFALNVNTDLEYFSHIIPCGITDKGVTSLQKELGHTVEMKEVKEYLIEEFETLFEQEIMIRRSSLKSPTT